jgi:dipeptidyl aminopeptidase/acylaminoacyl peptidase
MIRRLAAVAMLAGFIQPLAGQNSAPAPAWNPHEILRSEKYVRPPADVERIIMAPRTDISFSSPSPDRKWFLKPVMSDRGEVSDYGKPHLYLGGLVIDTRANRARQLTVRSAKALTMVDPRTGTTRTVETPAGATVSAQVWSPAGTQIAYAAHFSDASHAYVADVATGKSTRITRAPLLATLVTTIDWTADGKSVLVVLVPEGRGEAPTHGPGGIEDGPAVRLTEGRVIQQVMHYDLLEDPHDKALLKYFTTGQLALIDVRSKAVRRVGGPAMIRSLDGSPDGQYIRVTRMVEPFSYRVPVNNFGSVQELWDLTGTVIATLGSAPLRENDQQGGDIPALGGRGAAQPQASDTGKRAIQWHPAGPGLVFLQSVFGAGTGGAAETGRGGRGGGRGASSARPQPTAVELKHWVPPFGPNDVRVVYEGSPRLNAVAYSADGRTMFVSDSGAVVAIRSADPARKFPLGRGVTLAGGGGGFGGGRGGGGGGADTSATAGSVMMKRGPAGVQVVALASDNKSVFVSGTRTPGANWLTQGPRPWVDRLDFETGQRARVFESPADGYDEFVVALDDDHTQYIYTHETSTLIADAYLRDVRAGTSRKITNNRDVAPEVTGAQRKRFTVTRPRDGLTFWVDVTLPRQWQPGTRLPGIIWFYPREYTGQAEYDRSRYATNIHRFPEVPAVRPPSATRIWVTQGYAVIEPDIPIFGDSGRINDNYTRDLRENLDAVLDAVVDAGYVDRHRMGIGGHSYGAFGTVNAMTLVPYFKAGIAGDGMYNRSLTPYGFQSERRNFFEAQDTYLDMSPFYRADKLSGSLLLYHSIEDQNVGTALMSSTRMLHALQGLGKTAALYLYPYEDHSVATYQSDLDMWARWFAWFDIYVKNAKPETKATIQP